MVWYFSASISGFIPGMFIALTIRTRIIVGLRLLFLYCLSLNQRFYTWIVYSSSYKYPNNRRPTIIIFVLSQPQSAVLYLDYLQLLLSTNTSKNSFSPKLTVNGRAVFFFLSLSSKLAPAFMSFRMFLHCYHLRHFLQPCS